MIAREIVSVKFGVREAGPELKCIKCGWSGKGLTNYVVVVHYVDERGELMMMGFSFPFCIEHIPEQIALFPAGSPMFPENPIPKEDKPNPLIAEQLSYIA